MALPIKVFGLQRPDGETVIYVNSTDERIALANARPSLTAKGYRWVEFFSPQDIVDEVERSMDNIEVEVEDPSSEIELKESDMEIMELEDTQSTFKAIQEEIELDQKKVQYKQEWLNDLLDKTPTIRRMVTK